MPGEDFNPQVELVGVCDTDAAARTAFARDGDLAEFATAGELVSRGRPDVVHILTPPATHAPLAIELLRAGVHVLVEKPLALSTAEADAVLAAARAAGRWVSVDHNRWFDPVVQQAAFAVESGRLGTLVGVEAFQGAEAGEADKLDDLSHWSARLPGGVLNNLASHPLYLLRRFAGPLREVRVLARRSRGGQLEEVRLIGDGEHALGAATLSLRAQPFMNRLTLLGTAGTIDVNLNNMTLILRQPRRLPKLVGKVYPNVDEARQLVTATVRNAIAYVTGRQRFYPGIGRHLQALYAAVAAGEPPPVSAAEGRDVVVWYDAMLGVDADAPAPAALAG